MGVLKNLWRVPHDGSDDLPATGPLSVSFEFEERQAFGVGPVESAARSAQVAAKNTPFSIGSRPFFEASKASDWFCGQFANPVESADADSSSGMVRRLRCVKLGTQTLLENAFDSRGRLASVCYSDGETILYDWDGDGRAFRTRSKSGRQMEVVLGGDDLPRSIVYGGTQRFEYEYDDSAHATRVVYPDGVCVGRTFGNRGNLSSVTSGPLQIKFAAADSGRPGTYTLRDGSSTFEFSFQNRRQQIDLTRNPGSVGLSSFPVVHTFGAWGMSEQNTLDEILTPWGDRFRVVAFGANGPEAVWSPSGLQQFDYNTAGGFAATTRADGSRSMLYVVGGGRGLLINPEGVTLLELDSTGRLHKALGGNGQYSLIDYTRDGKVKRVATFTETFSVFRDSRGVLTAIHSDCGFTCDLVYSAAGRLAGLIAEGGRGCTALDVKRFLRFFWQCFGLRTIHTLVTG